jgi:hypothetical protein
MVDNPCFKNEPHPVTPPLPLPLPLFEDDLLAFDPEPEPVAPKKLLIVNCPGPLYDFRITL